MRFVDTHCHLNFEVFQNNINQVVELALESGVNRIVVPGIDLETSQQAVDLASKWDCIYAAIGIHPNEADKFQKQDIRFLEDLISEPKVVAVGEIGLDFHHHPETRLLQENVLESMLQLATTHQKPVILHSRNSLDDLVEIIKKWVDFQQPENNGYLGVFHGFEGNSTQGMTISSMKMAIGVGGPVTFKNAVDKQIMVKNLGIQNMVLETDSPLLSPHPFRGQTNLPSRILVIAEKIASILDLPVEEVSHITNQNAQSLFRWDETN